MKGWQFWLGTCLLLLFSAGRAEAQGLTVISPNGGESWLGASQQTITWSYVNVDNIKIEYSLNNGLSWKLLVSNYPTSALSYNWQVPALGSTQAKIRITSSLQFIQDESNAVFTIPEPSINLIYPNGGETCATGRDGDLFATGGTDILGQQLFQPAWASGKKRFAAINRHQKTRRNSRRSLNQEPALFPGMIECRGSG
jgi:hypothetical protein